MSDLRNLSNRAELSSNDLRLPFRIKHDAEDRFARVAQKLQNWQRSLRSGCGTPDLGDGQCRLGPGQKVGRWSVSNHRVSVRPTYQTQLAVPQAMCDAPRRCKYCQTPSVGHSTCPKSRQQSGTVQVPNGTVVPAPGGSCTAAPRQVSDSLVAIQPRVISSADCGFASTLAPGKPSEIVWSKCENLALDAKLATKELWRHRCSALRAETELDRGTF